MALTRWKIAATALLAAGLVARGAGVLAQQGAGEKGDPARPAGSSDPARVVEDGQKLEERFSYFLRDGKLYRKPLVADESARPGGAEATFYVDFREAREDQKNLDQILKEMEQMLKLGPVKVIAVGPIEYTLRLKDAAELKRAAPLLAQMLKLSPFRIQGEVKGEALVTALTFDYRGRDTTTDNQVWQDIRFYPDSRPGAPAGTPGSQPAKPGGVTEKFQVKEGAGEATDRAKPHGGITLDFSYPNESAKRSPEAGPTAKENETVLRWQENFGEWQNKVRSDSERLDVLEQKLDRVLKALERPESRHGGN